MYIYIYTHIYISRSLSLYIYICVYIYIYNPALLRRARTGACRSESRAVRHRSGLAYALAVGVRA